MTETQYDQLIRAIYEAATGRLPWNLVLDDIATLFSLRVVQILAVDKQNLSAIFSIEGGTFSPESIVDYLRHYHAINPRSEPVLALEKGQWMHCHEYFDDAFVAKDPFYQEFLIPHGARYLSSTKVVDNENYVVAFAAMRSSADSFISGDDLVMLDRVKEHLSPAMEIYLDWQARQSQVVMGNQLLSQFSYPMVLVNQHRRIHQHNDACRDALADTDYIVDRGGMLVCRDLEADRELNLALRALELDAGLAPGRALPERFSLNLGRASREEPVTAFAIAIRPEATLGSFGQSALALLVFYDPLQKQELDPFIVAETFRLTPAEARVAVGVAKGRTIRQIAAQAMVSLETVRTQLKSVFVKTGVRRQADLVRMLGSLPEFMMNRH